MAERQLDIVLKVKDLATGGFKQAAQSARAMTRELTDADQGGIKTATQSLERLAKLQQVVGAITAAAQGAQAAFTGIKAATAAFNGDMEAALKLTEQFSGEMQKLPMGIGQVFSLGQAIRDVFTGEREELEKINAELAKADELLQRQARGAQQVRTALEAQSGSVQSFRDRMESSGVQGFDRQVVQLEQEARKAREAAQQRFEQGRRGSTHQNQIDELQKRYDEELAVVEQYVTQQKNIIDAARAEADAKQRQAANEAQQRQQEQAQREAERAAEAAARLAEQAQREQQRQQEAELQARQRHEERLAQLQSDIRQRTLRANGQILEAELEQIREAARRQNEAATSEAERALIEQQRLLQEADARKREGERTRPQEREQRQAERFGPRSVGSEQVGRGFLGFASRFEEGREVAETARNTKRSADLLERVASGIEKLTGRPQHNTPGPNRLLRIG